jgi:hypothetical protein
MCTTAHVQDSTELIFWRLADIYRTTQAVDTMLVLPLKFVMQGATSDGRGAFLYAGVAPQLQVSV